MDSVSPHARPSLRCWLLGLAVTACYPIVAFYPYDWHSPRPANRAEWLPNGVLRFSAPGIATTNAAPPWLESVKRAHRLDVSLRVRAQSPAQSGPARIFTISRDTELHNLTLGQTRDRLVLRLRTPGSDANGLPEHQISGVFADARWLDLSVSIWPERVRVTVNGQTRLDERLPEKPLAAFDTNYRLALGNEFTGDRPWLGEIARATVASEEWRVDYLEPARLQLPPYLEYSRSPVQLVPLRSLGVQDAVINLFGFVPFGVVVGWLVLAIKRHLPLWTLVPAFLLSFGIELAQWLLPTRSPSIDDVLLNTLGGALGLLLAKQVWLRRGLNGRGPETRAA